MSMMCSTRTSPFWKKPEEKPESSYEQQCHFLEGGVTVMGKGLSKKEKKTIRKELAPEKKKLMKEIRGEEAKPRAKPTRRKKEPVRYRC